MASASNDTQPLYGGYYSSNIDILKKSLKIHSEKGMPRKIHTNIMKFFSNKFFADRLRMEILCNTSYPSSDKPPTSFYKSPRNVFDDIFGRWRFTLQFNDRYLNDPEQKNAEIMQFIVHLHFDPKSQEIDLQDVHVYPLNPHGYIDGYMNYFRPSHAWILEKNKQKFIEAHCDSKSYEVCDHCIRLRNYEKELKCQELQIQEEINKTENMIFELTQNITRLTAQKGQFYQHYEKNIDNWFQDHVKKY